MMDELIAFARARLDEDEAAAKAAVKRHGAVDQTQREILHAEIRELLPNRSGSRLERRLIGLVDRYCAAQVRADRGALHQVGDPARVLREVEAKRAIVDRYTEALADLERAKRIAPRRPIGDTDLIDTQRELDILRPVVEALVAVWCGHPGYRQERKP